MLRLREYASRRVELAPEQVAALAPLTRASASSGAAVGVNAPRVLQSLTPTGTPGVFDVRAGPYVGRLAVGGLVIDLTSRFPFRDLLHLLATAARVPHLHDLPPVELAPGAGVVDVLAVVYAAAVEQVVGVGLAKSYVDRRFTRAPYPGVPDATAHLSRSGGRPDRLITKAHRLTVDVPVNQALLTALDVLLRAELADRQVRHRLLQLRLSFAGTSTGTRRAALDACRDRAAPGRYRAALGLAAVLLSGQSLVADGAVQVGPSLVFPMTQVWEDYLAVRLRRALPAGHALQVQRAVSLTDAGPRMTGRADFVEVDGAGVPLRLLDAKYAWFQGAPSTADLYQVVTYAQRLRVRAAELLHPGRGEVVELVVDGLRVVVRGVDVLDGNDDQSAVAHSGPLKGDQLGSVLPST